ncbi:hypothetical protein [Lactococcus garvieae]|uniref:Uncharacterized protein n=1 Tax=Lactococcus garvieae TaxID=1363 RepID=A0AAX3NEP8_9LACT|nr:hypothetical protein [Lactococcus garvieae]NHI70439.1 hypothetical protein [Lactococcus garvieae]NHJ06353.1 hypothetical protein [Lactococcus garvieae]WEA14824.1 hypothetical protein PWF74_04770 [Lactococcus garvieae]
MKLESFMCEKCGSSDLVMISNEEWRCAYCRTIYYESNTPRKKTHRKFDEESITIGISETIDVLPSTNGEDAETYNPWNDSSLHLRGKLALVLFVIFIWIIVIVLYMF